jgi:hypothetical protein
MLTRKEQLVIGIAALIALAVAAVVRLLSGQL